MKRLLDITVALIALLLLSPVMALTALLVRKRLGTPILFYQQRPGLRGRPFSIWKFRTMTDQRDDNGHLLPDHQRLTAFGQLLRQWSLDELPQLFNVLKGDLSLVGPRPLLMEYLPRYSAEQARRHNVRPGITGWAQINGRNAISWEEKFRLDVWYVDHMSFWLDCKILALTALQVIRRQGINRGGHATCPPFEPVQPSEQQKSASFKI